MLSLRPLTRHEERRRTVKAVELAAEGWSFEEIAIQLGYQSESGPRTAVARHLKKAVHLPAQAVFMQMIGRIDRALRAIMPLVDDGDLRAIDTMLRLETQRAKLYGLDKNTVADEEKAQKNSGTRRPSFNDKENAEILKALAESGGLAEFLPEGVPAAALFLSEGAVWDDSDIPEAEEDPSVIEALADDFRTTHIGEGVDVIMRRDREW